MIMLRGLLLLLLALATISPGAVILDMAAADLAAGPIPAWPNRGGAGGAFTASGDPQAALVLGRMAVVMNGQQWFSAAIPGIDDLARSGCTIEAWVSAAPVGTSGFLVGLRNPAGGPGLECAWSTDANSGAFCSGSKSTQAFHTLPGPGAWHHLAWTLDPGHAGKSRLRIYVDGELDTERILATSIPAKSQVIIGGATGNGKSRSGFTGAIASVRLLDTALTQEALRMGAGLAAAFQPTPADGATTSTLDVTMTWRKGSPSAAHCALYFGTDPQSVAQDGNPAVPALEQSAWTPPRLQPGTRYFWRIEEHDSQGKTLHPGAVWSFLADPGLPAHPSPRDHDSDLTTDDRSLAWTPGRHGDGQRLLLAESAEALDKSPLITLDLAMDAAAAGIPKTVTLQEGTRYCWRIDILHGGRPATPGPTWTFRTRDAERPHDVTFFMGSDCHYGRENNAALSRRVFAEMNALPGTALPEQLDGGTVRTPRGVILNGDLLDDGMDPDSAPGNWREFCDDVGLTGRDGLLSFPVYEGFGNHDGGPGKSVVRAGIRERNRHRPGLTAISTNGLHYSWDWDHLHLVQANLFVGNGPEDVLLHSGSNNNPEQSLEFLREDLAKEVGTHPRLVALCQHFNLTGGMSNWWTPEAKERLVATLKPYRVAGFFNGHSHGTYFISYEQLLTVHDGSTARSESNQGDFLVVRITDREIFIAQRRLGSWGMTYRGPLPPPAPGSALMQPRP